MQTPYIVGWGHTPFGKLDNIDCEELFRNAAVPALASANIAPSDIDGIFVGHFNAGFVRQDFSASIAGIPPYASGATGECLRHRFRRHLGRDRRHCVGAHEARAGGRF
jgi:acetyl-CoA acetyltransferase